MICFETELDEAVRSSLSFDRLGFSAVDIDGDDATKNLVLYAETVILERKIYKGDSSGWETFRFRWSPVGLSLCKEIKTRGRLVIENYEKAKSEKAKIDAYFAEAKKKEELKKYQPEIDRLRALLDRT